MLTKREAGILLHISSLPGKEGIGTLGESAFSFADWLKENGYSVWQILPVCHAGFAQSPYLALSAFAGNPLFIDLETVYRKYDLKLELKAEKHTDNIDFGKVFGSKMKQLRDVFDLVYIDVSENDRFISFCKNEVGWLEHYALFASFRDKLGGVPLCEMPLNFRRSELTILKENEELLRIDIMFYKFIQFEFFEQWKAFRDYVNQRGIKILGDLPIYLAYDSCDVWKHSELFSVNEDLELTELAGVPPDYFSETGQLWGNPVYRWDKHKEQNYNWWERRMKKSLEMFDMIRIDHFRGFAEYWTVPAGSKTAVGGRWEQGPGMDFFKSVLTKSEMDRIIAEDLGVSSEGLSNLINELKLPGMKVLQFAFDKNTGNTHKPFYFEKNTVVYTGTHDNNTLSGWLESVDADELKRIRDYTVSNSSNLHDALIRAAMSSVAKLCIIPMQDILGLGEKARMNIPGTVEGNWLWRMKPNYHINKRCGIVSEMIKVFERSV